MRTKHLGWTVAGLFALGLASQGCQTIGTAGRATGRAAGNTAEAAGDAASSAVRGAGHIIEDTADAADDEMN